MNVLEMYVTNSKTITNMHNKKILSNAKLFVMKNNMNSYKKLAFIAHLTTTMQKFSTFTWRKCGNLSDSIL